MITNSVIIKFQLILHAKNRKLPANFQLRIINLTLNKKIEK